MRNRILKIGTKDPINKFFYVIQFILGAFQKRERRMRIQNMEKTKNKGKFENFI